MDRFIAEFPAVQDDDLMLCPEHGVAYQKDQTKLVAYDAAYYEKCAGHPQEIAERINAGRINFVARHYGGRLVDVGIGSGEFIRKRGEGTYGHDVNPAGIEWLKRNDLWIDKPGAFGAVSMWDVIEHVPTPEDYFKQIGPHGWVFCSLPIVYGLTAVRASKHYRPNEHLYYFTEYGFTRWMDKHGFMLVEMDDFEIQAGRESIYSFAFKRYKWPR